MSERFEDCDNSEQIIAAAETGNTESKNRIKADMKGSMTVEAALVMSMILFILFSMIVMTLWLRDRVIVTAVLREGAEMGRIAETTDVAGWMEEELGFLFATEGHFAEINISKDKAEIGWESDILSLWPGGGLTFNEDISRTFSDPAAFLRRCRILEILVEKR